MNGNAQVTHTPGPWTLRAAEEHDVLDWHGCHALDATYHLNFALIVTRMEGDNADNLEKLANARLIAAAPDQNAALIGLNDFVKQAQAIVVNYLIPDGLSKDEFINQIIAHLDGPVQRIAQGNAVRAIASATGAKA